jgi:hypothetical protein
MTPSPVVLENDNLRLTFDPVTGALIGLLAVQTGWEILNRTQLGLSFRLLVPLRAAGDWHSAGPRNNAVYGEKQALTGSEVEPGRAITLVWDGVQSELGGWLPIKVTLQVVLEDGQAIFKPSIENRSDYMVENVYCPYLGDVQHPQGAAWFRTFSYAYASAQEWSLWPTYQNTRGYFGIDYPTQLAGSSAAGAPMAPFILLRGEQQGLYVGVRSPSAELVAWHTELRPGYANSISLREMGGGSVPTETTIAGKPVHTRFAAVHVPYIQPGETRALTPIALAAYQGGWQHGTDLYRTWRKRWMKLPRIPAWAAEPHAWQQIHINSPEDELRVRFTDLPALAAECARHGVRAIQLVGWNDGGQDQGNPSHDPDPRLGSFDELKAAIAQCHALGVKIILFAKFTWADRHTPRFRAELERMAVKDPYGDFYHYGGYQYQTVTQLLDINTKRLIPMCFLSEDYLRVCDQEFQKMVALGAAGILYDESQHHSPALLCFDGLHGHRYGAPVYANDRMLIENFARLAAPAGPDFLFSGEACYDWEMAVYHLSYHRSESRQHIPLSRFLLPEGQFMTAVTGFNDRNMINQCLMYRYIISYEPYNFKGHLEDYPDTLAYGQQMDTLRRELREFLWDGEYQDVLGAQVTTGERPHHPYAVFTSRQSGQAAVVVCNYDEDRPVTVRVRLDSGQLLNHFRLVGEGEWHALEEEIVIPPCSAVVVV